MHIFPGSRPIGHRRIDGVKRGIVQGRISTILENQIIVIGCNGRSSEVDIRVIAGCQCRQHAVADRQRTILQADTRRGVGPIHIVANPCAGRRTALLPEAPRTTQCVAILQARIFCVVQPEGRRALFRANPLDYYVRRSIHIERHGGAFDGHIPQMECSGLVNGKGVRDSRCIDYRAVCASRNQQGIGAGNIRKHARTLLRITARIHVNRIAGAKRISNQNLFQRSGRRIGAQSVV